MPARPRPSLKARAIALLAQREHSRAELRRKLLARLSADAARDRELGQSDDEALPDAATVVDGLLDWLEAHDYLSATRFVESRVNARAARFGSERIRHELAQHGVALAPEAWRNLKDGEFGRARAIWARKFKAPAPDAPGRARQARFLAARGFSSDVIRRVVAGTNDEE